MSRTDEGPQAANGAPPSRAPRWWPPRRRTTVVAGSAAVVLLALLTAEATGWPFLQGPVERRLSVALSRDVRFEQGLHLNLLGHLRARAPLVVVGQPRTGEEPLQGGTMLEARDAAVTLPWSVLWSSTPEIRRFEAGFLDLSLHRGSDGWANWHMTRDGMPATDETRATGTRPRIGLLRVQEGRLRVADALTSLELDAHVRLIPATAATESDQVDPAAAAYVFEADATGRWRNAPFEARLHSGGLLPMLADASTAAPVPVRLDVAMAAEGMEGPDNRLHLEGHLQDLLQFQALDARVQVSAQSLAWFGALFGMTLPTTEPFSLDGALRRDGQVWHADVTRLAVGDSTLAATVTWDANEAVPRLTGQVTGGRLVLQDLGPAIGATPGRREERVGGRVLPQRPFDLPSLTRMDADVLVSLDRLDLGTSMLDVIAPLRVRVHLVQGVLSLEELEARSSGGDLAGRVVLNAQDARQDAKKAALELQAELRWRGVRLERFIRARRSAEGGDATAEHYVAGALHGHARVQGRGRSTAQIMASLDGDASLWVRDGRVSHLLVELAGLDLAQGLGLMIQGDAELGVECAMARLRIERGQVHPEPALVDTSDSTLVVSGALSLGEEQLDLMLRTFPKDRSPFALRAPLRVQGTFAAPTVQPELGAMSLRLLSAAVLAVVAAPAAALLAFIDLGEADLERCAGALSALRAPPKDREPEPAREP